MHPDTIDRFEAYRPLGAKLLLENMDARKPGGRTAEELRRPFAELPEAGFCFDIAHAWSIDPSMAVAHELLDSFVDRLRHVHLSSLSSDDLRHVTLTAEDEDLFNPVLGRCLDVPWIFEAPLEADSISTMDRTGGPLEQLEELADRSFDHLLAARERTADALRGREERLGRLSHARGTAIVLMGSWGRAEVTTDSDDDFMILVRGEEGLEVEPTIERVGAVLDHSPGPQGIVAAPVFSENLVQNIDQRRGRALRVATGPWSRGGGRSALSRPVPGGCGRGRSGRLWSAR